MIFDKFDEEFQRESLLEGRPTLGEAMTQNVHLVVIDPQNDFMDNPTAALGVPGANADMERLAAMVDRLVPKLNDVHVTLDSHNIVDTHHPAMWRDAHGAPPPPFTVITADDIRAGIWTPRNASARPGALGGWTIKEYMIRYAEQLAAQGSYLLMIWPPHCLIGTEGAAVQPTLMGALNRWADRRFGNVDFVTKGVDPWTEHYGALQAEVPLASDPSTGLNTDLLATLERADMVVFAGEALSHCLRETVNQVANNIDEQLLRKMYLLTDCTSAIPQAPGGPDFPAISAAWLNEMEARGLNLTTSVEFLA